MLRRRPGSTLFPYTTLFRSSIHRGGGGGVILSFERSGRRGQQDKQYANQWCAPVLSAQPNGSRLSCERNSRRRTERRSARSEEHTSELQSLRHLVCRLLLEK